MAETHSDPAYGYTVHMRGVSFDDARARVTDALKQEGFGILPGLQIALESNRTSLAPELDHDVQM